MTLSEKIVYCRRRSGLTQEALAEKLGVSRQAVSKWETGDAVPELGKLPLLSGAFGVTADWLLSGEEPAEPAGAPDPAPAGVSWVDTLPGKLGKLLRRYGWLGGVYLSVVGALVLGMGLLSRYMVRRMLSGFGQDFSTSGAAWHDGVSTVITTPFAEQTSSLLSGNPVYIMGALFIGAGALLLISGIILALYLKRRSKKS